MNQSFVFSTAYFPSIYYFYKILESENILIEKHENYIKQTYRNRCNILTSNGIMALSIPIKKSISLKTRITDVEIDYDTNWQQIHLRAIDSAYNSSPFHEYYIDAFIPFFEKKYKFLFDFNLEILNTIFTEIELNKLISFTSIYEKEIENDYRNITSPKYEIIDIKIEENKYEQVFSTKFEFTPNMCILDLLFNEGPNTILFLESLK